MFYDGLNLTFLPSLRQKHEPLGTDSVALRMRKLTRRGVQKATEKSESGKGFCNSRAFYRIVTHASRVEYKREPEVSSDIDYQKHATRSRYQDRQVDTDSR